LPLYNGEEDDLWISAPFAHAILVHHYYISLPQVIQSQNLSKAVVHIKKLTLKGTLTLEILFQGKDEPLK
jgi:hypothetical protein